MNDRVKLTTLQMRAKQHKLNHVVGGVMAGNVERTPIVSRDHDVLKGDQMQHDLQKG